MGKIILIAIAVSVLVMLNKSPVLSSFEVPQVLATERQGKAIKQHEFQQMVDKRKPFKTLAKKDSYTVVEAYLDSCGICKRLEAGFPAFLDKRKDVVIQRVHVPESGIQISFTGSSQEEVQKMQQDMDRLMKSYDFCGTPHVVIYDPDKQLLVADSCTKKDGTRFLERWMAAE